jgi:hypothetical protein
VPDDTLPHRHKCPACGRINWSRLSKEERTKDLSRYDIDAKYTDHCSTCAFASDRWDKLLAREKRMTEESKKRRYR